MTSRYRLMTAGSILALGMVGMRPALGEPVPVPAGPAVAAVISPVSTDPAAWQVDRADVAAFTRTDWAGRSDVLKLSVTPPARPSSFYNWQGYHQQLDVAAGPALLRGDLWLDAGWQAGTGADSGTDYVRTGIWGAALPRELEGSYVDAQSVFPIISFTNQGGTGRLEVWEVDGDHPEGQWVDLPASASALDFGGWNRTEMRVLPGSDAIEYYVNGTLVYTWDAPRNALGGIADQLSIAYLQARNNGVTSFDTYWSALATGQIFTDGGTITAAPDGIEMLSGATGTATVAAGTTVGGSVRVDAGSDATLAFEGDARVATEDAGEHGVVSDQGGTVTLDGGAVTTSGGGAHGLFATGTGSMIVTGGTDVTVTGAGAHAADATAGGGIAITGGAIGANGRALSADGGTITATNAAISGAATDGADDGVAFAARGGSVSLSGGSVTAMGARLNGLMAVSGGTVGATDVAISASGDRSRGAYASASQSGGGAVTLSGGTIETSGVLSHGLFGKRESGTTADTIATIDATDVAITANGTDANGVYADVGSRITVRGGSVATGGQRGYAFHAQAADDGMTGGGTLSATGVTATTTGGTAYGGYAEKGGQLDLSGGSIHTSGGSAYGLMAVDAGSRITSSANVTTDAEWVFGAYAKDGGRIDLTGGTITTYGERAHGILAELDGTITSAAAIVTHGDRAHGAEAGTTAGKGSIVLQGGSITTDGEMAYGLLAYNGSSITGRADIATSGGGAFGVSADGDGTISLSGGTVTTSGDGSHALQAVRDDRFANAGTLTAKVAATTSGAGAYGAYAKDGGKVALTGGSIATSGAGAHGIVAEGAGGAAGLSTVTASGVNIHTGAADAHGLAILGTGSVAVSNGTIESAGTAIAVAPTAGDASIAISGTTVTAGSGIVLAVDRSGGAAGAVDVRFSGGAALTGDVVDGGHRTDLTLDGARLNGALDGVRTLTLSGGGTWAARAAGAIDTVAIATGGGTIDTGANRVALSGTLTGTGALVKAGAGTLALTGNGSGFTGTTTIDAGTVLLTGSLASNVVINSAGTLQIGDGAAAGDLTGATRNDGTLIFARSDDYDYTGALSGNGGLIKRGDGTLLLSGAYSYTGSTVVEGGRVTLASALDPTTDLVVDNGVFDLSDKVQEVSGLSGEAGTLALGDTGALTVNQSGNTAFAGSIQGNGSLIKTGAGTLNLTGESSFTGTARIDGGRLAVNGVLPAQVVVAAGGTLGGNGTIHTLSVASGGTVAPGNSIGTLHTTGDVGFGAGSVYAVEVDADGRSDQIITSGKATLSGGTVSVIAAAGNYRWTSDYTILTAAGGVTGRFAGTDVDLPFLTPMLDYGANAVVLTLIRNDRSFASLAGTANQRAVAGALDGGDRDAGLYRAIVGQVDDAGVARAFDALSGEIWASTGTALIDQGRRTGELVLSHLQEADEVTRTLSRGGPAASGTQGGGTAIWGQAIGAWNRIGGDGNAASATQSGYGFITGLDTRVGAWRVGAAFSHGETKLSAYARASSATARTETVAAYAGGGWGALRLHLGAAYAWHDVDGRRTVAFPGLTEDVSGGYDGRTASAFGEVSYALQIGATRVEPFAGVDYLRLTTDGFGETGGAASALSVGHVRRDVTFSTLGLRAGRDFDLADGAVVTPFASAAWRHGFGDTDARGVNRLSTGDAFRVTGIAVARDMLALQAGAQARIMPGGTIGISYAGNIATRWNDHGVKLGFSYAF